MERKKEGSLLQDPLTLLSFPRADIRSAHSLVYSKFFRALSTAETYLEHKIKILRYLSKRM